MTEGCWMTGGCWVAHPASNMAAATIDRNFTLHSLASLTPCARRRYRCGPFYGVIHDDRRRYPQTAATNQRWIVPVVKWLNEKRDTEISSRLIPLVDDLTHILIEAGKNNRRTVIARRSRYRKIPVGCVEPFCFASRETPRTHQQNN
jgi:hypothetical protein